MGEGKAYELLKKEPFHVVPTKIQGGRQFDGPGCRKILAKAHILEDLLGEFKQFGVTLSAFNKVVEMCFTSQELVPGYRMAIKEFEQEFTKLNISFTPKVHCVIDHVSINSSLPTAETFQTLHTSKMSHSRKTLLDRFYS